MNPFDIKSLVLAKHAQHVVLIHFPIALFIVGVGFDFVAQWKKQNSLATVAYYNLMIAGISVFPVVTTGIIAWCWQLEGARLHGVLLLHFVLAVISTSLILLVWWIHQRARRPNRSLPTYRLPVELVGVLLVGATAHLGGFLSGVNG